MDNNAKYVWTVSVIAVYNPNEMPLSKAYDEFEDSIKSIVNRSESLRFVIFFYNSEDETAIIKKSQVRDGLLVWEEDNLGPVDIYEKEHKILIEFFKVQVSWPHEDNREHKQFLIVWGHGAGLGLLRTEIKEKLRRIYAHYADLPENHEAEKKYLDFDSLSDDIHNLNSLTSKLALDKSNEDYRGIENNNLNFLVSDKLGFEKDDFRRSALEREIGKLYRCLTPNELTDIIKKGLETDKSKVTVKGGPDPAPTAKIQIMLCLTCYTSIIESAYVFKDLVNIYIAPQTIIPFYGYNYKKLFALLNDNPAASETEIADNITHFYLAKYLEANIKVDVKDKGIYGVGYKNDVAFSAVYAIDYEKVSHRIRLFVDYIFDYITNEIDAEKIRKIKTQLLEARRRCDPLGSELGIIDYENFITEFLQFFEVRKREFTDFYYFLNLVISDYCPGLSCRSYLMRGRLRFISPSPGSFSIFFPNSKPSTIEKELQVIYKKMKTADSSFQYISKWDSFIDFLR